MTPKGEAHYVFKSGEFRRGFSGPKARLIPAWGAGLWIGHESKGQRPGIYQPGAQPQVPIGCESEGQRPGIYQPGAQPQVWIGCESEG